MEENSKRELKRPYTYFEWQNSIFGEIEVKIKTAENSIQKFLDVASNSPAHAVEYYSEDVIIASIVLQELNNLNDKLMAHPTVSMCSLLKDKISFYLQHYKNKDFRHNSTSLISNAINIWRNEAYSDCFEIFERAVKLYDRIDK